MIEVSLDQDTSKKVRGELLKSPISELRKLVVVEHGECLLISGRVRSFYHKQLAQETVRHNAPGWLVLNRVDVD